MAGIEWTRVTDLPSQRSMLPNEWAFRIGCVGCKSDIAGCFLLTGTRLSRDNTLEDIQAAAELTGIPTTVITNNRVYMDGNVDSGNCNQAGLPCKETDKISLFAEINGFPVMDPTGT